LSIIIVIAISVKHIVVTNGTFILFYHPYCYSMAVLTYYLHWQ